MLPIQLFLYPENTQVLNVRGLQDVATGNFLDAATVQATLFDQNGHADPVIADLTLSYLTATDGDYQGTVPASFSPAKLGAGYNLVVLATQSGIQSKWTIPVVVKLRAQ